MKWIYIYQVYILYQVYIIYLCTQQHGTDGGAVVVETSTVKNRNEGHYSVTREYPGSCAEPINSPELVDLLIVRSKQYVQIAMSGLSY